MSSNSTIDVAHISKSIIDDLNLVTQRFINYLPLIFLIFGFIGFIGNAFTYLQAELRSNTCCIYLLCGSFIDIITLFLNLFPNYLDTKYGISMPWYIFLIWIENFNFISATDKINTEMCFMSKQCNEYPWWSFLSVNI